MITVDKCMSLQWCDSTGSLDVKKNNFVWSNSFSVLKKHCLQKITWLRIYLKKMLLKMMSKCL